jgi:hypothetical protein
MKIPSYEDLVRMPWKDDALLSAPTVPFLYRHYVELMLKSLIFAFNEPNWRRRIGQPPPSDDKAGSLKTHSLQMLWDRLRPGGRGPWHQRRIHRHYQGR